MSAADAYSGLSAAQVAALQAEGDRAAAGNAQFFWAMRGRGGGRGGMGSRGGRGGMGGMGGPGGHMGGMGMGMGGPGGPMGGPRDGYPHGMGRDGRPQPHYMTHRAPPQPRSGGGAGGAAPECWFCLASPHVEKHLIVAIGSEAYVALPKGGVHASHALVVPISHHVSVAAAPASLRAEVGQFVAALAHMYAAQGLTPVLFERVLQARRGETPVHSHLQIVGLPRDAAARACAAFVSEGKFKSVPFESLPPTDAPGGMEGVLGHVAAAAGDVTAVQAPSAPGDASSAGGAGAGSDLPPAVVEYLYVEVLDPVEEGEAGMAAGMAAETAAGAGAGAGAGGAAAAGTAAATAGADAGAGAAGSTVEAGAAAAADGAAGAGAGTGAAAEAVPSASPAPRLRASRLLHRVPPGVKHPVQFGREVLCRLLDCPERLSWKACAAGQAETAATEAFRRDFAPFDFTAEL